MTSAPELQSAKRFALMLETACRDFESLTKFIRKDVQLIARDRIDWIGVTAAAQMALAKSFIFHVVRSRRICEHEAPSLNVGREDRRRFLAGTSVVQKVRDVNEHGFDPPGDSKVSQPSMHFHSDIDAALDETSLIILGHQKILMRPINLWAVYLPVDRMRQLAGFQSLPHENE